ncbi:hypothetical protein [Fodinibius halophilus]|uniref:Uncharacterized protein n=1 Tax=Fodinibius halophilus TaxID=1736908 RepID=A0A6M1T394_9BACT|nr:hypothetical protein [Fodinibius halophilus]NGP89906.1 hypothetical protein [Fodinibius halophilus]
MTVLLTIMGGHHKGGWSNFKTEVVDKYDLDRIDIDDEYQSFSSLLDECKSFLTENRSELLIMSLMVNDWSGHGGDRNNIVNALEKLLSSYLIATSKVLPQMGDIRGEIFLYNRINDQLRFGTPINWPDATSGAYAKDSPNRFYQVYVQDKYKGLPNFGAFCTKIW